MFLVENKPLNIELNNTSTTIEQMKTQLNFIGKWNLSYFQDQLEKLEFQVFNHFYYFFYKRKFPI